MKKLNRILSKIFLFGLPVVLGLVVFSALYERGFFKGLTGSLSFLHNFTGLTLALWMALTVYLSILLLVSPSYRNEVLTKFTFMKERDEREIFLSGKATKTTFLMTLALLFFLLCLSCFQVSVFRLPPEKAVNGKTGAISLGLHVDLFQKSAISAATSEIHRQNIFRYTTLPISATGIILLLIIWHICCYHSVMRRAAG